MKYKVLLATVNGSIKTALVHEDSYNGDPSEFFVSSATNPELAGEIDISGDEHLMPDWLVGE